MFSYRLIAMVLAAFCAALAVIWFVDAGLYMETYGVALDDAGNTFGRRVAPILLGLSVLLYQTRDAPPSPMRQTICFAIAVVFAGVACTGVLAYLDGSASFAILVAAATEVLVAMVVLTVAQSR